jgi:hypothetical protein
MDTTTTHAPSMLGASAVWIAAEIGLHELGDNAMLDNTTAYTEITHFETLPLLTEAVSDAEACEGDTHATSVVKTPSIVFKTPDVDIVMPCIDLGTPSFTLWTPKLICYENISNATPARFDGVAPGGSAMLATTPAQMNQVGFKQTMQEQPSSAQGKHPTGKEDTKGVTRACKCFARRRASLGKNIRCIFCLQAAYEQAIPPIKMQTSCPSVRKQHRIAKRNQSQAFPWSLY